MSQEPLVAEAPKALVATVPWPLDRLREGLLSANAEERNSALAMTVLPEVSIDGLADAITACLDRARDDPVVVQLAVIALGKVKVQSEIPIASGSLLTLVTPENPHGIRAWATHGFANMGAIPEAAWPSVAPLLFDEDESSRKTVLKAITPFAVNGAAHIAQGSAAATPANWTPEGLAALALSAGTSDVNKNRVEQYVMRSLQGLPLSLSTVAGYVALARLNPKSAAPMALASVAAGSDDGLALAAVDALARIGVGASATIPTLVEALRTIDNPDREEAICAALLKLQIRAPDVPLPRVVQQIGDAQGSTVTAYCGLLCAHAKVFAAAATVVAARHAKSGESLQNVLSKVHQTLTGKVLAPMPTEPAQKP